jgi:protein Tex
MSQSKQLPTHILIHIAEQLNIPLKSLAATITLLDEGGTVRFLRIRNGENPLDGTAEELG